jgi:hypothetical protein
LQEQALIKKVGLWLALSALLVNGPRFVIIFLKVDSIDVPKPLEATLLAATGIATGLVLTGGGAYIAHALAESKVRGMMRWFMVLCWFLLLIFSVVLLAPLMVAAIDGSSLRTVLDSKFSQWLWSITSVLAVEVIAGGAMVAYALHGRVDDTHDNSGRTPDVISVLTSALAQRIANNVTSQSGVAVPTSVAVTRTVTNDKLPQVPEADQARVDNEVKSEQSVTTEEGKKYTKQERHQLLLQELQNMPEGADVQVDVLSAKLKVSQQTIYRDLAELRKSIGTDSEE